MNLLNPVLNFRAILAFFSTIFRQHELTVEMTKREFSEKYAGQILGVFWGFAHPFIVIFVYLFIFSFVFQVRLDSAQTSTAQSTGSYAIFMLAGLIPWMALAEALNKGTQVITNNSNLVKQVIFPLEVLPTKTVLATCINEIILLSGVLIYAATQAGGLPLTWLLVPVLLVLQAMQMLGISLVLAGVGACVRDLKDLVQVFCHINIYLMPIVYMAEWLPPSVRWLIYLNPFTYQTLCFQDAIYHGEIQSYWVWAVYCLMSIWSLGVGYRAFSKLRASFGNLL